MATNECCNGKTYAKLPVNNTSFYLQLYLAGRSWTTVTIQTLHEVDSCSHQWPYKTAQAPFSLCTHWKIYRYVSRNENQTADSSVLANGIWYESAFEQITPHKRNCCLQFGKMSGEIATSHWSTATKRSLGQLHDTQVIDYIVYT